MQAIGVALHTQLTQRVITSLNLFIFLTCAPSRIGECSAWI